MKLTKEEIVERIERHVYAFKAMKRKRDQAAANVRSLNKKMDICNGAIINYKRKLEE